MVKTYPNQAAYEAAEKSKIESAVSLIESTGKVVFDGVNVITENPGVGDIVCYDENRKIKFIQLDTFQAGTFPSAWETVGVVVLRKGNQVTVCSKHSESHKFMDVYPYIVTGYELDGQEHTAQLRLHGRPSTEAYYEFKYKASTVDEFVTALQQFLTDNGESDWSAYKDEQDRVILQYDNFTSLEYLNASITYAIDITLQEKSVANMPGTPSVQTISEMRGYFIWNAAKAKVSYRKDLTNIAYNPSSDLDRIPNYPICWPAFAGTSQYQEDHCLWLRQKYCKDPEHPTVEEWESYIDSLTPLSPYMTGSFAPEMRDRDIFDKIKSITYTAPDGTQKPLYPGANYCSKFFDGKGYMPAQYEFYEMFKDVTLGITGVTDQTADAVNRSLYAIGGNTLSSASTYWLCARGNASSIRAARGLGNTDNESAYTKVRCIPVVHLDLSELTE